LALMSHMAVTSAPPKLLRRAPPEAVLYSAGLKDGRRTLGVLKCMLLPTNASWVRAGEAIGALDATTREETTGEGAASSSGEASAAAVARRDAKRLARPAVFFWGSCTALGA
jgi:hypothetical protein